MHWSAPGLGTADACVFQPRGLGEGILQTSGQTLSAGILAGSWPYSAAGQAGRLFGKARRPVVLGVRLQAPGLFAPGPHVGFVVVPGEATYLPADLVSTASLPNTPPAGWRPTGPAETLVLLGPWGLQSLSCSSRQPDRVHWVWGSVQGSEPMASGRGSHGAVSPYAHSAHVHDTCFKTHPP